MDVSFRFSFGDSVVSREGIVGFVETNSLSKGMSVNRVGVEYVTNEGERKCAYFDEDDLDIYPEEE